MRVAAPLFVCDVDRERLSGWLRAPSMPAGAVQRARIVLLSGDGVPLVDVAAQVGVSVPTVRLWRQRYATDGGDGLADRDRPGRPGPAWPTGQRR